MRSLLFMLVIGLFFGTGVGFLVAAGSSAALPGHDHGSHDHGAVLAGHDHSALVEAAAPAPTVAIEATAEGNGGLNLHILTANIRFAPEHVNQPAAPGEGHAHVYVNGVKVLRAYGPWVHLSGLAPGPAEVRVTLNANDHGQLATGGRPIESVASVEVK